MTAGADADEEGLVTHPADYLLGDHILFDWDRACYRLVPDGL